MLVELALALILTKIMDEIFIRKKLPPVVGEILIGILFSLVSFFLPPTVHFANHEFSLNLDINHPAFDFFADMGILSLLFLSGMETNLEDFKKSEKSALLTGIFGVLITFLFGFLFSLYLLNFDIKAATAFGTIYTATSVGVTARTMMDMGILHTRVGNTILAAAVVDDIFGIVLVTVVLSGGEIMEVVIGITLFFLALYLVSRYRLIEKMMDWTDKFLHIPFGMTSVAFGIMLLLAYFAQLSKIAPITGAYFAGLLMGQSRHSRKITMPIRVISSAVFIPIFFVKVGILVDFELISCFNLLLLAVIPLAFMGKIMGCGLGAKLGGMNARESLCVGVGMVPEMEVALVIATLAYSSGVFGIEMGTAIITTTIIYVMVSSILTPIILKKLYERYSGSESPPISTQDFVEG